jgi:hypothetical protein
MSSKLDITIGTGTISGLVYHNRNNFETWIINEELDDDARGFFSMFPDDKLFPLGLLKTIKFENLSVADKLMREFLYQAITTKNVVLIAKKADLSWYNGWGFSTVGQTKNNFILVLNNY